MGQAGETCGTAAPEYTGQHTGSPEGLTVALLARSLLLRAGAGRKLQFTAAPVRILCTHTSTQTYTKAICRTQNVCIHSQSILPRKGETCVHLHTRTQSLHKMERLSGRKIHIDRVESHKHPGSLRMSNIPLGADHSVLLLYCFKIELHKRFKTFGGIKYIHRYILTHILWRCHHGQREIRIKGPIHTFSCKFENIYLQIKLCNSVCFSTRHYRKSVLMFFSGHFKLLLLYIIEENI